MAEIQTTSTVKLVADVTYTKDGDFRVFDVRWWPTGEDKELFPIIPMEGKHQGSNVHRIEVYRVQFSEKVNWNVEVRVRNRNGTLSNWVTDDDTATPSDFSVDQVGTISAIQTDPLLDDSLSLGQRTKRIKGIYMMPGTTRGINFMEVSPGSGFLRLCTVDTTFGGGILAKFPGYTGIVPIATNTGSADKYLKWATGGAATWEDLSLTTPVFEDSVTIQDTGLGSGGDRPELDFRNLSTILTSETALGETKYIGKCDGATNQDRTGAIVRAFADGAWSTDHANYAPTTLAVYLQDASTTDQLGLILASFSGRYRNFTLGWASQQSNIKLQFYGYQTGVGTRLCSTQVNTGGIWKVSHDGPGIELNCTGGYFHAKAAGGSHMYLDYGDELRFRLSVGGATKGALDQVGNFQISGTLTALSSVNASGGVIQTGGTTRITNAGALTNVTVTGDVTDAGSSRITLGGNPTDSVIQSFTIDVNESNLAINNIGGTPLEVDKGGTNYGGWGSGDDQEFVIYHHTGYLRLEPSGYKASDFTTSPHDIEGADHDASGLTIGHVLRASGAAAFAFAALIAADIPSLATSKITSGTFANSFLADMNSNTVKCRTAGIGAPVDVAVGVSSFLGRTLTSDLESINKSEALTILNVEDGADVTATAETSHADVVVDGDFGSQGFMKRGASPGSYTIQSSPIPTGSTQAKCIAVWPDTWSANQNLATTDSVAFDAVDMNSFDDEATKLGKTGNVSLDSATDTAAEWAALPVGYHRMMSNAIGTAGGAPLDNYGYFVKAANRDSAGGWGGIWVGYAAGQNYMGRTATSGSFAAWDKLISSANLTDITALGAIAALTANQIVETDGSKNLISAAKGSAYNKSFGTGTSNVPEIGSTLGNSQTIESSASGKLITAVKNTAYNKDFAGGGAATTVSRSDHTHGVAAHGFDDHDDIGTAATASNQLWLSQKLNGDIDWNATATGLVSGGTGVSVTGSRRVIGGTLAIALSTLTANHDFGGYYMRAYGFWSDIDGTATNAGFRAGTTADVQWYRDAANRWGTPDSVWIKGGQLSVGATWAPATTNLIYCRKDINAASEFNIVNETNALGTAQYAAFRSQTYANALYNISHGSARTGNRYGQVFANYGEILGFDSNCMGLLIGCNKTNSNVVFGAGSNELIRLQEVSGGKIGVFGTTPVVQQTHDDTLASVIAALEAYGWLESLT